jgi:hypothetical protein
VEKIIYEISAIFELFTVLSLSIFNFNDSPLGSFYAKMRVKRKEEEKLRLS